MRKVFMRKNRKAQAAFEYMHTYGWAILVMVVLGGTLFYYNVSDVRSFLPMECSFLSGVRCVDANVETDLVSLVLLNEFGFAMGNMTVNMTGTCDSEANTTIGNPYGNPSVLLANQQGTYVFECQNLSQMEISERVTIGFINVDSGEQHLKVGKLEFSPTGT